MGQSIVGLADDADLDDERAESAAKAGRLSPKLTATVSTSENLIAIIVL
jgi:hypothetical protein